MSETTEAPAAPQTETTEAPAAGDSLRDLLTRAYDESVARSEEPATTAEEPAAERPRDESGRFQAAESETKEAPAPTAVERPESWSESEWNGLTPEAQQFAAKREQAIRATLESRAHDDQEVVAFRQAAEQNRDRFAQHGLTPAQAFNRLLEWETAVRTNPVEALSRLAAAHGVDLRSLADPASPQSPVQFRDPRLDLMLERQAAEQAAQARNEQARITAEIASFEADPKNVHFAKVRTAMGALFHANEKLSLRDAYDQAVWADPTLRVERLEAERREATEAAKKADAERAKAARAKSVQVRSSPGAAPGYVNGTARRALRDDLRDAWDRLS